MDITVYIDDNHPLPRLICVHVKHRLQQWNDIVMNELAPLVSVSNLRNACGKGVKSGIMGYMDTWTPSQKKKIKSEHLTPLPIRPSSITHDHPEIYNKMAGLFKSSNGIFKQISELLEAQYGIGNIMKVQMKAMVGSEFKMFGTPFTTATINVNTQLELHTDSNNISGSYSVMATFTDKLQGGNLEFPSYGLSLQVGNGDLIIMDGFIPHRTTPIKYGRRVSIVMYARKGIIKHKHISKQTVDSFYEALYPRKPKHLQPNK